MERAETSAEIDAVAAEWTARLDRGPLAEEEQAALDLWMAGDVRRRGALARAMAVMAHFDRARALAGGVDPLAGARPHAVWGLGRRQMLQGGAIAAGLGALALGTGVWWSGQGLQVATAKGEVRGVPLSDGSVAWLNTDSRIKVRYSDSHRGVELIRGEALFDVAADTNRPFVVEADGMKARAVGTSFTVSRLVEREVEVQVRKGVVDFTHTRDGPTPGVRLAAGARAVAKPSGKIVVSAPGVDAVTRATAWRHGMLDFDGVSLADAAAEFARYSDRRIVIDDPSVGRLTVTGLFSSTDPGGFARAVAVSLDLKARTEAGAIHLGR